MYFIIYNIYLLVSALVTGSSATIPFFEPRPNNVSFHVGDTATLLCSVRGLQTRIVSIFEMLYMEIKLKKANTTLSE
jgi:hypothetical protein